MDEKLKEKIDTLKDRIKWAGNLIKDSEKELKELEKQLDEKKPWMYTKNGAKLAIIKYKRYSDMFVEFETHGNKYRCVFVQNRLPILDNISDDEYWVMQSRRSGKFKFKQFNGAYNKWENTEFIDHIELLEGVCEYDQD